MYHLYFFTFTLFMMFEACISKWVICTFKIGIYSFNVNNCNLQTKPNQMIPNSQYRQNSQLDLKCQPLTHLLTLNALYGYNVSRSEFPDTSI